MDLHSSKPIFFKGQLYIVNEHSSPIEHTLIEHLSWANIVLSTKQSEYSLGPPGVKCLTVSNKANAIMCANALIHEKSVPWDVGG